MCFNSDSLSLMSPSAVSKSQSMPAEPSEPIKGPDNAHEALRGVVAILTTRPVQTVRERWPDHGQATRKHHAIQ
eukprot:13550110-Alexandrium_andersonii.AAC.1